MYSCIYFKYTRGERTAAAYISPPILSRVRTQSSDNTTAIVTHKTMHNVRTRLDPETLFEINQKIVNRTIRNHSAIAISLLFIQLTLNQAWLQLAQSRNVRSKNQRSQSPAIHVTSRILLRSSSTHEPNDPPHRVIHSRLRMTYTQLCIITHFNTIIII